MNHRMTKNERPSIARALPQAARAIAIAASLAAMAAAATGCEPGGVSLTITPVDGESGSTSGGLGGYTLKTIQSKASSAFKTNSAGTAFFDSRTLPVVGACSRGTASMRVTLNSVVQTTTYPCPTSGDLTIDLSLAADGLYVLVLTPLDASGVPTGVTPVTQNIYALTGTPTAPIVTDMQMSGAINASGPPPFVVSSAGSYTISGTFGNAANGTYPASDNATSVTESNFGQGTVNVNASAGTFTYDFTVTAGQAITLIFKSVNIVGGVSSGTTVQIQPPASPLTIYNFTGAGSTTPTTSGSHSIPVFSSAPLLSAELTSTNKLILGVPHVATKGP